MKAIPPQSPVPSADGNRVLLAADTKSTAEFEGELEKYQHLKELAELFFAAKRHHPKMPVPPQA
jgi:hypothetical protein